MSRSAAPPSRSFRGFTLVEVMVALLVMSIMAALAWRGVDGMLRSRDGVQGRIDAVLRLQTVIAQWDLDIANVIDTESVPPLSFDSNTLRLTRSSNAGVQLVTWTLRGRDLYRWSSPPVTTEHDLQDYWLRSQQLLGGEPGTLVTMTGLEDWQLYFYQDSAWANAQSTGGPDLPAAVRVVLGFAPGAPGGITGHLTRDTRLGPQP